jgi:hypothetical protein
VGHFQAVYYRDPAGFEPVRDFVDALPEHIQAAVENQIARLNLLTDEIPHLPFPHSLKRLKRPGFGGDLVHWEPALSSGWL